MTGCCYFDQKQQKENSANKRWTPGFVYKTIMSIDWRMREVWAPWYLTSQLDAFIICGISITREDNPNVNFKFAWKKKFPAVHSTLLLNNELATAMLESVILAFKKQIIMLSNSGQTCIHARNLGVSPNQKFFWFSCLARYRPGTLYFSHPFRIFYIYIHVYYSWFVIFGSMYKTFVQLQFCCFTNWADEPPWMNRDPPAKLVEPAGFVS